MANRRLLLFVFSAALISRAEDLVPGQLIVQHRPGSNRAAINNSIERAGAKLKTRIEQLNVSVLQAPEHAAAQVTDALQKTGLFTFIEQDHFGRGSDLVPNDPSFPNQWHLATIQGPSAWSIGTGSPNAIVAIIDSGVDSAHPDLSSKLVPGWNFLSGAGNTADVLGHGTAVAGTAAAASNNGIGVTGVSWGSMIMPLVVLNSSDYAAYSDIANAITYAADHGARVINVSISGTSASSILQNAVNYAWNKGSIVFAAAGNGGSSAMTYPAACTNVVAVSATNSDDSLASFSSYGSWIDLSAPGNNIVTTTNGGGYGTWYGTSFASPIAAGVASLVLSLRPAMSNAALVSLLEQNSDDLGAPGFDPSFGWGRINAYRALSAASSTGSGDTIAPAVTITSPASGSVVSGSLQLTGSATDNVGVVKIELYLDNSLTQTVSSSPFSFTWNTLSSINGSHLAEVRAYDAAGNVGFADASITVNNAVVTDLQPPSVSITTPIPNATLGNQTTIDISAVDNVGVTLVTIYVDNVLVSSLNSAPYSYNWNTHKVQRGAHVISAKSWDAAGNLGTSPAVTVYK